MWGWNPAYTFHGGNTFYYMRLAKQRGCKFVLVDPQYTDSASTYDAWWIPIKPNTDAAMLAGMAYYIFANNLQDQNFINRFTQGMDQGTMPHGRKGKESFKDYILGNSDGVPKTPEWAAAICGVKAEDIVKLAHMYATTKPAALKASWSPGRNAYGEQYNRMAAAVQAMTGNIGVSAAARRASARPGTPRPWPIPTTSTPMSGSPRSNRTAGRICVLNYPNVKREEIGLWPRRTSSTASSRTSRHLLAGLGLAQPAHQHQQGDPGDQEARGGRREGIAARVHGFDDHADRHLGRLLLPDRHAFRAARCGAALVQGPLLHPSPKVIQPLGESKTDFQVFTELAYRLGFGPAYNPRATATISRTTTRSTRPISRPGGTRRSCTTSIRT
jgi:anaerobic dimethyl sulfoxide reductase subunit A